MAKGVPHTLHTMNCIKYGAKISDCGRYRYNLYRQWAHAGQILGFIMLNPSTANATVNDQTIRKCMGFAQVHGYVGVYIVNLFAWRATDPMDLLLVSDPVGPDNDQEILMMLNGRADTIVCAWGNHGDLNGRDTEVITLIQKVGKPIYSFGLTKSAQPKHPLMLSYKTRLKRVGIADDTEGLYE